MRKLLSFFAALILCSTLMSTSSRAVEIMGSGTCGIDGDNLVWVLDGNGVLTISGLGAMETDPTVFYENALITTVIVEDGVTSIGNDAFWNCPNLTSVTLPGSIATIGNYAFSSCTALTSITIPNGVISIGEHAFSGCSSLTSIAIPGTVDTVGHHVFSSCSNLSSVTIHDGVSEIGSYAFIGCTSLETITLPNSINAISDYMFYSCRNLKSVTIPAGVTSIGGRAFSGCDSMALLDIPDSVTNIGTCAFYGCSSLTHISIPDSVTSIHGSTFLGCSKLTSITIPDNVTSIGNAAFRKCSNLTYITIPDSVTSIGSYAFSNCSLLTDIYYGGSEDEWTTILSQNQSELPSNITVHCNSTGPEVPDTPTISVTTRASDGKPKITWSSVENATGYEVYVSNTLYGQYRKLYTASASKLNVTHVGAEVGESYFYKVCSVNNNVKSAFSNAKSVWCDLKQPVVKVTNRASDGKPYISWTAVDGATSYEVYRCGTKNGNYVKMYTAPADDLDIVHTGAVVGQDYFYKVRAIFGDNSNCNSAFSTAKGVWCDLKQPVIQVTNRASDGKPTISWSKVDGATGYEVYCKKPSGSSYEKIYTATATKLNVTHTGAKAGEGYSYQVVAVYTSNIKCNSSVSAAKSTYCALARPSISVNLTSTGKPNISWTKSTGADGYYVYYATQGSNYKLLFVAPPNRISCTHTGAKSGVQYTYKVVAVCAASSKCNSDASIAKFITAR